MQLLSYFHRRNDRFALKSQRLTTFSFETIAYEHKIICVQNIDQTCACATVIQLCPLLVESWSLCCGMNGIALALVSGFYTIDLGRHVNDI